MSGPLVRCVDVGLTYGAWVHALTGVNCLVEAGDRIAVMGPSGSGKSSLLHLFAGLLRATSGEVTWPGLKRGQIGVVFQEPALVPSLTVLENVALPLTFAGVPADEAADRALDALTVVGVESVRDDLTQDVSGGQAQRVAIARVVAGRPRLILADEPTSKLDRATADRVVDLLLHVSDELDAALVVATHDPAVGGCLKTLWRFDDGRMHWTGTAL